MKRPYYYISYPLACCDPTDSYEWLTQGEAPAEHEPWLQPAAECLVLSRWIMATAVNYARQGTFYYKDAKSKGAHAVLGYTANDFHAVQDMFVKRGGTWDASDPKAAFFAAFVGSFAEFGVQMPANEPWTLFTGETPRFSLDLVRLLDQSKQEGGRTLKVAQQLSTSWNFNVALSFSDGGALVVLHYEPEPGVIRAHLVQEFHQYTRSYDVRGPGKPYECEILLQPGLYVRYIGEEVVKALPLVSLMRHGALEKEPRRNVRIIHAQLLPASQ